MKRIATLSLITFITGCATAPKPMPMPAPVIISPPPPCEMMVAGKCKSMTAQEKSGATTLGHHRDEDIIPKAAAIPGQP